MSDHEVVSDHDREILSFMTYDPDGNPDIPIERTRAVIRKDIELGLTMSGHCRVCNKQILPEGVGPHMVAHRRLIGDLPPVKRSPRKTEKRKYTKKPSVDDACYGMLSALVGEKIPLSMVGDVQAWVEDTKKLIESLK